MDSFLGLIDWILTMILWVGIPVSLTFTLVFQYFETVKIDDGKVQAAGNGGDKVSDYFKTVIKFIVIAIIAWVAIYLVRDIIPAAGSSVVGGLGF